jgi:hypothetical protein
MHAPPFALCATSGLRAVCFGAQAFIIALYPFSDPH